MGESSDRMGRGLVPWDRDDGHGHLHGEDAALARKIANGNSTAIRFDGLARNGKPQPQTRTIGPSLFEWAKQFFNRSGREATTFILDFDRDAIGRQMSSKSDVASRSRELERVLKQIRHGGCKELSIDVDDQAFVHRLDAELDHAIGGVKGSVDLHLLDEIRDPDVLPLINPRSKTYFGQGSVDECTKPVQASLQDIHRAPRRPDFSRPYDLARQERCIQVVAELVSKITTAPDLIPRTAHVTTSPVLRDGIRDRDVEKTVEGAEFTRRDIDPALDGQFGDGLADVTVILNHLRDGEPSQVHLAAMSCRTGSQRQIVRRGVIRLLPEDVTELSQEEWNPMSELVWSGARHRAKCDLLSCPSDQLFSVRRDEVV